MIENDRLKKSIKWTGKSYGGRFGNACFAFLLRFGVLPAYALVALVAAFFMVFRRRQCAESSRYLSRIAGRKVAPISPAVYKHLFSFGISIIDKCAYFSGRDIKCDDRCKSAIGGVLARGRGCVVVVSHIGGWAISGGELARYGCPTGVIGVSQEHEYIDEMFERRRKRASPKLIATAGEPFAMIAALKLLRENGVVALHGDRYAGGKSATVELFGSPVRLPTAAYALAAKSGAGILNVFCLRGKSGVYTMAASTPAFPENSRGADFDAASAAYAAEYARQIETVLRRSPEQWFNFYPFWAQ